ncbi:SH3 domain-containing protein [Exiguobacterium sp. s157]|uniref:C40 family peptidase n=1 Tax=Exiguobacterium sp. s157 TaxID=2751233 RepID=UPI0020375AD5|nr:SH3 domain-containing protein [Exiguobacterium sp. s157]
MSPKSGLMYSFAAIAAVSIIAQADEVAAASSHVVRAGDTLWSISQQHNVSLANLKAYNNLNSDRLAIGQTLKLSGNAPTTVKPAATPATSRTGTVTTAALNMRLAAGTWHQVLVTIPKGQTLTPIQTSGAWTKVSYGGKTGWVHNGYLTTSSVKPAAPITPTPTTPAAPAPSSNATVTTAALNMRAAAGTWHQVLVTIPKGQTLTPIQTSGAWTKVSYGGKTGWVHNGYLTNSSVKPTTPSTPTKPAAPQEQSINQSYVTTANLNVRQGPGIGYALVTSIPNGTTVKATKQIGTWVYVTHNGKSGYVSTGYLKQTTTAPSAPVTPNAGDGGAGNEAFDYVVNTPSLNVRASASTSSAIIGSVKSGQTLRVVQTSNGWHQIYIGNTTGFVAASYVKAVPKGSTVNPTPTPAPSQGAGIAAIAVAKKYVGTPYIWASSNPANGGFDCSGLIHYAFNQAGYSVPRTNVATYWAGSYFGTQLSKTFVPQAGDLVFFENTYTAGPSHMGIMINADTFIHAGTYGLGYNTISKEPYWKSRVIGYKRP